MQLEKGVAPGGAFEASFCVSSSHWQAEQGCSRAQVLRLRRLAAVAPLMAILGLGITMISGEAGGNGKDGVGMAALVLRGVIPVGDKVNGKDRNLVLLVGGPAGQSSNRGIGKPIFLEKMAAGSVMQRAASRPIQATEGHQLNLLPLPKTPSSIPMIRKSLAMQVVDLQRFSPRQARIMCPSLTVRLL